LDGPVVLGAAPRGAHFLIKQELARGLGGRILLAAGQIPVDRAAGRGALEAALGVLRAGRVVGIFPEGARGAGRVASIHAGVAWLAVHSGAPVVPVVCLGSRREGESVHKVTPPRRRVYVGFGQPVDLAAALALPAARDRVAAAMEAIREALEAHVAGAEASTGLRLPRE
jgi:1-acyl-sn-glycerol-3-phosphate acyltransferase